jgi:hypothetical protein
MATGKRFGYKFSAPDLTTIKLVPPRIAYKLNYEFVSNDDHLLLIMESIKDVEWVAIDTETTSLNFDKLDLVAISFAAKGKSYCVVVKHNCYRSFLRCSLRKIYLCLMPGMILGCCINSFLP